MIARAIITGVIFMAANFAIAYLATDVPAAVILGGFNGICAAEFLFRRRS